MTLLYIKMGEEEAKNDDDWYNKLIKSVRFALGFRGVKNTIKRERKLERKYANYHGISKFSGFQ